ncbi:hypothetical protein BDV95DRAFT_502105 [Massariosphaeria phaeospora]|uniref:WSC domain-containing protein n=1 Tax=Massariosphaeria phaeospora TaxID=100035 RepID=A0A7C8M7A4_9PLEO|nr:hypothetical protein BDV95DRAFT_502105 [Massariosphaeria phaeospora]
MGCPGRVVRNRLDPIVNPGGVASHVHTISGGSGFGPSMTFQQARDSKCSSCQIKEDMSNYWTPQLMVQMKDGTFQPVPVQGDGDDSNGGMTVYYLQRGEKGEQLKAFPEGFRMLAGDPNRRNFTGDSDAKAINYNCLGGNKPETNELPNYNCPGGLRAQVFFPSCWDGKNLDSDNHRSHMSYPVGDHADSGACPSSHPVHLISIFFEILYDTPKFLDQWNGDQQPFVFSNGDKTGYGLHGDFVNGWDVDVLQKAVDTCTDNSGQVEKCGAVTMFTPDECKACKIPSVIDEPVDGILKALAGCNKISAGPEYAAPPKDCASTAAIGAAAQNFVDLTSTKKWAYTGCGTDKYDKRTFTGKSTTGDDMTVEKCVDFCSGAGFTYAGLEYGRECYCDNKLDKANAPKDGVMGSCTTKCSGNNKQFCGAAGALSIYHKCEGECKNIQIGGAAPAASSKAAAAPSASPKPQSSSNPVSVSKAAVVSKAAATPKPSTTKPTKAAASSMVTPAPTPTKAPDCPRNNCINQIFNPTASVSASSFCASYTKSANTAASAIPQYLHNCYGDANMVTSACKCLSHFPTGMPKIRRHAREI